MEAPLVLAEGIEVYRGYTIERRQGRYSIPFLTREGVRASFVSAPIARFIVDALITGACVQQCGCGFLAVAPADKIGHFIIRHRNRCGPGRVFQKIA